MANERFCMWCGDDVPAKRWALGYQTCLFCGEEAARIERQSWCVTQQYQKGAYQLVTRESAAEVLRGSNQKAVRV